MAVSIKCSFYQELTFNKSPICVFQGIELTRNRYARIEIQNSQTEKNATKEIVIKDSSLELFPREIRANFPNLEKITMEYLRLEKIDRIFFAVPYRTVKYLKVQGNPPDKVLTSLKGDTFQIFPFLEVIDFSYNKLSYLEPNLLVNAWHLREVSFKGNEIQQLDSNLFFSNRNLEKIDLSENFITTLPDDIFKNLVNLQHVDFGWNRIDELPDKLFENNENLLWIDFKYNVITKIYPGALRNLDKVKRIDFGKNICVDGNFVPQGRFDRQLFDLGMVSCYQNCKTCGK